MRLGSQVYYVYAAFRIMLEFLANLSSSYSRSIAGSHYNTKFIHFLLRDRLLDFDSAPF